MHVYVATLDLKNGVGYVSVSIERKDAHFDIVQWCWDNDIDPFSLDMNDEVLSYGVSYLSVKGTE